MLGKYDSADENIKKENKTQNFESLDIAQFKKNDQGEVSHFQALATAVSGTVGNGNIAGVALAIAVGGPGATFWMILSLVKKGY